MKTIELIAIPSKASFDILGAARCVMLEHPEAYLIHPVNLLPNVWNFARTADWFKTTKITEVDWDSVKVVYLVDIIYQKHSPKLINLISGCNLDTILYSLRPPKLPFKPVEVQFDTQSLTAGLLVKLMQSNYYPSKNDSELFSLAINERTWVGLNHNTSDADQQMLDALHGAGLVPEKISNSIILGMRECQVSLYKLMLQNVEYLKRNGNMIAFIAIPNMAQVYDLDIIIDRVWSDLSVASLIILISYGSRATLWARSSLVKQDYAEVFKKFRPVRNRRWTTFSINKSGFSAQRKFVITYLSSHIKANILASDIMAVAPICIEQNESIESALAMMLKFNIMSLIVTSENKFVGIISRRDIDRAMHMKHATADVGTFSHLNIPFVSPNMPACDIKAMMTKQNISKLPVVDNGQVVGLITQGELLRYIADDIRTSSNNETDLPSEKYLLQLIKRFFPIKIVHLLTKIGKHALKNNVKAYAVGGFVRDLLLEKKNLDLDIVIIGNAIEFARDISESFGCDYKVFERFHTARIYFEDMKIDFSSARIEYYATPGALPNVTFSGLSNDLNRRDFSVNALALSLLPDNFLELKDFFGGYIDLKKKLIRILHQFSFLEDPTRLFRAIRFMSRFNFVMEKDTRRAFDLAIQKGAVSVLSLKRIGSEVSRCFNEEQPHKSIKELFEVGLMKYLDTELTDISVLPTRFRLIAGLVRRFSILDEEIDTEAIYWTGLLSVLPVDRLGDLLDSLGVSHTTKRRVIEAIKASEYMQESLSNIDDNDNLLLYNLLNEFSLETFISLIVFSLSKLNAKKILYFIGNVRGIACQVSGKDFILAGIPPGPHIREYFSKILEKKLTGEIMSKEEELNYAIKLYKCL